MAASAKSVPGGVPSGDKQFDNIYVATRMDPCLCCPGDRFKPACRMCCDPV